MKICLVNPPVNQHYAPLDIPLQLLILATIARDVGWEPHIVDFNLLTKMDPHFPLSEKFFKPAIEYIKSYKPNLLGITCLSSSVPFALEIARRYKSDNPACKIILGGPHATLLHEPILERYSFVDMVCRGEGEYTLKELLMNWDQKDGIAGLSYRIDYDHIFISPERKMMTDLDQTPIPDYGLIDLAKYKRVSPWIALHIEAGRGCPYACTYCSTSLVWGRRFRIKSIPRLIQEIAKAVSETGITKVHFIHDLFSYNKKWVDDLCNAIISKDIRIEWGCDTRVDTITKELLKKLARSGCKSIFFGIESGSESMQRQTKKNINLNLAIEIITASIKNGISTTAAFIFGHPRETLDELNDTIEFIFLLQVLQLRGIVINVFTPEYGTEAYQLCQDKLEPNYFTIRKDLPFAPAIIVRQILNDPEIFSHFYFPGTHKYDYKILPELIRLLQIVFSMDILKNTLFDMSDHRLIDILIEAYPFFHHAMRFDEYQNVKYDPMDFLESLISYQNFIFNKYQIYIDKNLIDKQKVLEKVEILNDYNHVRMQHVKSGHNQDQ